MDGVADSSTIRGGGLTAKTNKCGLGKEINRIDKKLEGSGVPWVGQKTLQKESYDWLR